MIDRSPRWRLLAGFLLVDLCVLVAVLVTFVGEPPFDRPLVLDAAAWRDGAVGEVMDTASDYGYGLWLAPASVLIAGVLVVMRRSRDAAILFLATSLAVGLTRILKETFERARPEDAHELVSGFSMPSGHATSAAAFAVSLLLVLPRTTGGWTAAVLLVLGALLVGLSRVVLGVHYPSDVFAGFCSGAGIALVVSGLVDLTRLRRAQRAEARSAISGTR